MYVLTASTNTQFAEEAEGDEFSLLTKHINAGVPDGGTDHMGTASTTHDPAA
jgi:hypothetical protein